MVYAALPAAYLDPPHWNQDITQQQSQQQRQQGFQAGGNDGGADRSIVGEERHRFPPPVPTLQGEGTGSTSSNKSLSTSDRARLAKLPQPESAPVRCPRCDSTNTKFCYFNNYSLSQPRHFCKACRRYWTRGGALRNVPVGGGCRRNKRTKGSGSSKGPSAASVKSTGSAVNGLDGRGGGAVNPSITIQSQLPFLASLNRLPDYVTTIHANYGGITAMDPAGYHTGSSTGVRPDQWINNTQVQHFPFLTSMELSPPPLVVPSSLGLAYQQITSESTSGLPTSFYAKPTTCTALATPLPYVKMEESIRPQGSTSLLRSQLLSISGVGYNQYWDNTIGGQSGNSEGGGGAAPWTDLLGLNSSTVNTL